KLMLRRAFACVLVVAIGSLAIAEDAKKEADGPVSFTRQIQPILRMHCQGCHQPAKKGGEYVMTSFESLVKGGESGETAVVPGQPAKSEIIAQITPGADGKAAMPKGMEKPLS